MGSAQLQDRIGATLDRIAATGVAMELNTSGLQKRIPEMNPARTILVEMRARGIPVMLGADAHVPERVAADYVPAGVAARRRLRRGQRDAGAPPAARGHRRRAGQPRRELCLVP
ncbi:MAG: hypothetical protein R3A10_00245 [Caldilineaceae bacterium]